MTTKQPIAAEFNARLARSRQATKSLRERAAEYFRTNTGRGPKDDSPEGAPVIPLLYAYKEALNPAILDRNPVPYFKDSDASDEIKRQRAAIFGKLCEYYLDQFSIRRRVIEVALEECEHSGMAAVLVDKDMLSGEPRVTFIPNRDFDIDLDAKHPDLRFVRWASHRMAVPLASARQLWPNYDFVPDTLRPQETDQEVNMPDEPDDATGGNQTVTVWHVYVKGTDPYRDDIVKKPRRARNDQKPPEGVMFPDGASECIYFAYAREKGTNGPGKLREIGREEWAERHMLPKRDEFPYSFLRLTIDTENFWPRSMFDPVRGAADQANWAAKYEDDDARRAVRRLVLIAKTLLGKKKAEDLFANPENLLVHTVDNPDVIERGLKVVDFGEQNKIAASNADRSMFRFEAAARVQDLTPQARSHESSHGARLRAEVSGARTGRPAAILTEFTADILCKMMQCAYTHMTADQVASIVGEDMLQFVNQTVMKDGEVPEVDPLTGETRMVPGQVPDVDPETGVVKQFRYSPVWNEDATPLEILQATDLYIDPASMARLDRESEFQMLTQFKQIVANDITTLAQIGGAVPTPDAMARTLFGFTSRMADVLGVTEAALALPNPDELYQAPPGVTGAEAAPNANGPNEAAAGGEAANPPGS